MAENYRDEFDRMEKCTKDQEHLMWMTAISSINMTHCCIIYFHSIPVKYPPPKSNLQLDVDNSKGFAN